MNSVVTVNWEDADVARRIGRLLSEGGYVLVEDYEQNATRTQIWSKSSEATQRGRWIDQNIQQALDRIPVEKMVALIRPRLKVYMDDGVKDWEVDHAATMLVYDLQGKPG